MGREGARKGARGRERAREGATGCYTNGHKKGGAALVLVFLLSLAPRKTAARRLLYVIWGAGARGRGGARGREGARGAFCAT